MSKKLRLQVGAAVIVGALAFIVLHGANRFTQYFVSVQQYRTHYAQYRGQVLRVEGTMLASSVHYNSATSTLRFTLMGDGQSLPVEYQGPMPSEQFQNADAIVEGQMNAQGVFVAQKLMVKCPDHYTPATSAAAG
ncbi:MAG: cytochrome c maturation protein CcmE [Firmicutes bacterium]|nr:cytochrome c maturation protein CcmE [Alicyclobacillaceae bacterium]MCL6497740.1 cytochrome c maturation protein CcmE [Bacillota bacterium]